MILTVIICLHWLVNQLRRMLQASVCKQHLDEQVPLKL